MSRLASFDALGRRLRRPLSLALIPAALMALATTVIAGMGIYTYKTYGQDNTPPYQVEIVVEGQHDWNISQRTVDAAMDGPILSHRPLTLTVTDRLLTGNELLRGSLPAHDILLSTRLEKLDPADADTAQRFNGVAVRSDLLEGRDRKAYDATDIRFEIDNAFRENLGLGHGPKSIIAAAQRAAVVLYDPPNTNPVFWITLVALAATATTVFLLIALRYNLRWEAKHRRLAAAQRKLARVVLDLEALEATYHAAPAAARPEKFTRAWNELQDLSLELARTEDDLVERVHARSSAFDERTAGQLADFEATARRLTRLADALMGAGSVHARMAGTGSTLDRLSAPINTAMTSLLIRLERAPGGMVANTDIEQLRTALGQLLDASAGEPGDRPAIARWQRAEEQLITLLATQRKKISKYPHGRVTAPAGAPQGYRELKTSLGLDVSGAKDGYTQAAQLDALVKSITGDTLASDKTEAGKPRTESSYRPSGPRLALMLGALLLVGMIPAGITANALVGEPFPEREGSGRGAQLEIDDPSGELSDTEIIRYMDTDFPVPTSMVVAVRDAEAYLDLRTDPPGSEYRSAEPLSLLGSLHRIKQEYPQLLDPVTKELNSSKAIIPVFYTDEGTTIAPGVISPEVSTGRYTIGGTSNWEYGSIFESKYPDISIADVVDDYAQGLERNGFEEDISLSFGGLFWLLTMLFFFTVVNIALTIRFLLTATGSLGRFVRGTGALRSAKKKLEGMLLGLDESQINAVAVLGSSSSGRTDEAGQRLFERALAMALREERELDATPLNERLHREFSARVAHLDQLVGVLAERDADVARRARALITATRGAGGDVPPTVALPGGMDTTS